MLRDGEARARHDDRDVVGRADHRDGSAALGVPDDRGSFAEFVVSGMTKAQQRAIGPLPRQHGMLAALLIQYGLGMIVNLYVSVPARDQGGGLLTAVGRALANGPAALTVHAALGLLLILGAVNLFALGPALGSDPAGTSATGR